MIRGPFLAKGQSLLGHGAEHRTLIGGHRGRSPLYLIGAGGSKFYISIFVVLPSKRPKSGGKRRFPL